MQAQFVSKVIDLLDDIHVLIDTSGHARENEFRLVIEKADLVFFDLKIMDEVLHYRFTKRTNKQIFANLMILDTMNIPFVIRIPLIPGVTDTKVNYSAIVERIKSLKNLKHVELMPYNPAAGGKYQSVGVTYSPGFEGTQPINIDTKIFNSVGITVKVL